MRKFFASLLLGIMMLPATASAIDIPKPDFLPGPTDQYEEGADTQDYVLNKTIPRVINISIGLLGLAAFLGILIAAINMFTAYGNEDKINRAKTGMRFSLIGFAVVMLSYAIVSVVVSIALPQDTSNPETETTEDNAMIEWLIPTAHADDTDPVNILFPSEVDLIQNSNPDNNGRVSLPSGDLITEIAPAIVVNFLYVIGFLVFIAFIWGGTLLVVGRGNEEMTTKAKNIIIWSAVGLAATAMAYAIVYGIATLSFEKDATTDADEIYIESDTTKDGELF